MPCFAIVFDVPASELRARNRARGTTVPTAVLERAGQGVAGGAARRWPARASPRSTRREPVHLVPAVAGRLRRAPAGRWRCASACSCPASPGPAGRARSGAASKAIARAAESAGFDSLWVMDHFRQIPGHRTSRGRTCSRAGRRSASSPRVTERVRLGTMVSGITYRNVAHLGKIVATLDVLSGGRAMCGLGAGLVRAGARRLRLGLPAGPRPLRAAGGRPAAAAAAVGPGHAVVRGSGR